MMKPKFILFDFDGVIADSFDVAFDTVKSFCPAITKEDYQKLFDGNISEVKYEEAFHSAECNHDQDWFEIYVPKMKEKAKLFPGIEDVIFKLEREYTLVIVSSSTTFPIEEFLILHNLRTHFDWVLGLDEHKSKIEKIKMVFEKYKISSKDCIFVTDTLGDMREATHMEVPSIAVTWGFQPSETLIKGNPFAIVNTPPQLLTAVSNYFSK